MNFESPYGIYVNPYTGYMYATDAGSYASSGSLIQWSPDGELLGKHKTYINPAHFLALPPGSDTDSINDIETDGSVDVWYNLLGIRIASPVKAGFYIRNGKKVFFKVDE